MRKFETNTGSIQTMLASLPFKMPALKQELNTSLTDPEGFKTTQGQGQMGPRPAVDVSVRTNPSPSPLSFL